MGRVAARAADWPGEGQSAVSRSRHPPSGHSIGCLGRVLARRPPVAVLGPRAQVGSTRCRQGAAFGFAQAFGCGADESRLFCVEQGRRSLSGGSQRASTCGLCGSGGAGGATPCPSDPLSSGSVEGGCPGSPGGGVRTATHRRSRPADGLWPVGRRGTALPVQSCCCGRISGRHHNDCLACALVRVPESGPGVRAGGAAWVACSFAARQHYSCRGFGCRASPEGHASRVHGLDSGADGLGTGQRGSRVVKGPRSGGGRHSRLRASCYFACSLFGLAAANQIRPPLPGIRRSQTGGFGGTTRARDSCKPGWVPGASPRRQSEQLGRGECAERQGPHGSV